MGVLRDGGFYPILNAKAARLDKLAPLGKVVGAGEGADMPDAVVVEWPRQVLSAWLLPLENPSIGAKAPSIPKTTNERPQRPVCGVLVGRAVTRKRERHKHGHLAVRHVLDAGQESLRQAPLFVERAA
jgi:hypothetical protein